MCTCQVERTLPQYHQAPTPNRVSERRIRKLCQRRRKACGGEVESHEPVSARPPATRAREYAGFKGLLRKNATPSRIQRKARLLSRGGGAPLFSISGKVSSPLALLLVVVVPILPSPAPDPTPPRACSRLRESSPLEFIDRIWRLHVAVALGSRGGSVPAEGPRACKARGVGSFVWIIARRGCADRARVLRFGCWAWSMKGSSAMA